MCQRIKRLFQRKSNRATLALGNDTTDESAPEEVGEVLARDESTRIEDEPTPSITAGSREPTEIEETTNIENIIWNVKEKNMRKNKNGAMPEFEYLENLIRFRLDQHFHSRDQLAEPDFPPVDSWHLPWEEFADRNELTDKQDELTLLLIGLMPHIRPGLFDDVIEERLSGTSFPGIGGVYGKNCRFFLPTGETALFLLAGDDHDKRMEIQHLFGAEHIFWEKKILWLEDMQNGEPAMHGRLIISPDYVDLLTYGEHRSPQFSISFPAKKIAPSGKEHAPSFESLVISEELKEQIEELKNWLRYNEELMNRFGMKEKLKKGYRTLFYGPPGTGKTFTAQILGNDLKKEVFKIDLSMIVSKYIGETEKNLELLFARAEDKGWILFFDEADALFGKRTNVRDAHDKYANQEVSYLLQRIEDYNGLVILATNMKNNIDDAFLRRFSSVLKFPFPDQSQRAQIWRKALPKNTLFRKRIVAGDSGELVEEAVDIPDMVKKYELAGGNIINVVHYASIKAVEQLHQQELLMGKDRVSYRVNCDAERGWTVERGVEEQPQLTIYLGDILEGIKRELHKEGKPFVM